MPTAQQALRGARRVGLRIYARVLGRRRYDRLVIEQACGRTLLILPQVFNPRLLHTGQMLAGLLDARLVRPGATVLDMGTGSGIGAICAARWAGRVVAVDISPEAVRCARINALLNRVEDRVEVCQGDLFGPLGGQRFDLVLFNPPFFRGAARTMLDHAWRSENTVERFAAGLREHLAPGGAALVLLSSEGDEPAFLAAFRAAGLELGALAREAPWGERFTVYYLRERDDGSDRSV